MADRSYDEAFNDGLEKASLVLRRKAHKMRMQLGGAHVSETMARIFDAEADEILALRRHPVTEAQNG